MAIAIALEVKEKKILIIGGGKVGYRKASKMIDQGGLVTVVSPEFHSDFERLEGCTCIIDVYKSCYLDNMMFVVAASSDSVLNRQIYLDAKDKNILCSTVDVLSPSDFSFMATKEREGLTIAVSTSGQSPIYAKNLVKRLFNELTEEDFRRLSLMGQIRTRVLTLSNTQSAKEEILRDCGHMSMLELEQVLSTLNF